MSDVGIRLVCLSSMGLVPHFDIISRPASINARRMGKAVECALGLASNYILARVARLSWSG